MQILSPSSPTGAFPRSKKQQAFSLVELLVAVSIASFVLAGGVAMFLEFTKSNLVMAARSEFDKQMRHSIQLISKDTRLAANAETSGSGKVKLFMPSGAIPATVTYSVSNGSLMRQEESDAPRVIMENVSLFNVAVTSGEYVDYSIELDKSVGTREVSIDREVRFNMRN
ncbi:MAG: PilW family protein [Puniceicoccales bacterium]